MKELFHCTSKDYFIVDEPHCVDTQRLPPSHWNSLRNFIMYLRRRFILTFLNWHGIHKMNIQLNTELLEMHRLTSWWPEAASSHVICHDWQSVVKNENMPMLCRSNACVQCMINVAQYQHHTCTHILKVCKLTHSSDHPRPLVETETDCLIDYLGFYII